MTSEPQRLQKVLAAAGIGSRRACEQYITEGRVKVDGKVITRLGARVDPASQRVEFDGRPLQFQTLHTFLADKPRHILCTSSDPEGRPTLVEWAIRMGADPALRLYSIGRLDGDSEGLILLTNDGPLAHRLMHPSHHVEKEYRVWTDRFASRAQTQAMLDGVEDRGEQLKALAVTSEAGRPGRPPALRILLGEGRNRHIRRMLETVGLQVKRLRRIRIGSLTESDLRGRPIRELSAEEIRQLKED